MMQLYKTRTSSRQLAIDRQTDGQTTCATLLREFVFSAAKWKPDVDDSLDFWLQPGLLRCITQLLNAKGRLLLDSG